jgi:excinuclease ABC subunit C
MVLEANLINKYKPKFNILLRENSNYPYIVVTNEKDPRIVYTKNKNYDGKYYGPFANNDMNKYDIYNLLQQLFPLRKCNKVPKKKCLYYDMGICLAPCINKIENEQYENIKKKINDFFNNNDKNILNDLKQKEEENAKSLNFEKAKIYHDLQNSINQIKTNAKINVQVDSNSEIDVVGYYVKDQYLTIVIHKYIKGKLLEVNKQINEYFGEIKEYLSSYLNQYYLNNKNVPKTIYIDSEIESLNKEILSIPKKGNYKQIVDNANLNAKHYFEYNLLSFEKNKDKTTKAFEELKVVLNEPNLNLIHVFDISNLFEKDKVGGMIALENGIFNKKLYRKFIIKNEKQQGDVQYMTEVISRQYKRMIDEKQILPNLIIVDGGINQIHAAIDVLKQLKLDKMINVIGLSKDKKHKTDKIITNTNEIVLDKKSGLYSYLFNIQEEVHRFAITFNRQKRMQIFE